MNEKTRFKLVLSEDSKFYIIVHKENEGTKEEKIGCLILATDKKFKEKMLVVGDSLSELLTVEEIIDKIKKKNMLLNFSGDWVGIRTCFGIAIKSSDYTVFDWDALVRFDEPIEMLE